VLKWVLGREEGCDSVVSSWGNGYGNDDRTSSFSNVKWDGNGYWGYRGGGDKARLVGVGSGSTGRKNVIHSRV
jgi:hypothetical protein